jgi:hypothetical protein
MDTCISGWAMLKQRSVAIEDICTDARITSLSEYSSDAKAACFELYVENPVRPEVFVGHIATIAGIH